MNALCRGRYLHGREEDLSMKRAAVEDLGALCERVERWCPCGKCAWTPAPTRPAGRAGCDREQGEIGGVSAVCKLGFLRSIARRGTRCVWNRC